MLRFELIPLRDSFDQALTWTRPDFLVLRYELRAEKGLLAQVSVSGMGDSKHALGETSEGLWRFEVFPFASDLVMIQLNDDRAEVGSYLRHPPFEIRLNGGGTYRMNSQSMLEGNSGEPVFSFEQHESFPRWHAELKLEARAMEIPELSVLALSACCMRVFR